MLIIFGCAYGFLPIHLFQFLICMYPAHCWGKFKTDPTPRRAWATLLALVIAAPQFFALVYFAEGLDPTQFKLYS